MLQNSRHPWLNHTLENMPEILRPGKMYKDTFHPSWWGVTMVNELGITKKTLWFRLTAIELISLNSKYEGGLSDYIIKVSEKKDIANIMAVIEKIVLTAYGEKHGSKFYKKLNGKIVADSFQSSEEYSILMNHLLTDPEDMNRFFTRLVKGPTEELSKSNTKIEIEEEKPMAKKLVVTRHTYTVVYTFMNNPNDKSKLNEINVYRGNIIKLAKKYNAKEMTSSDELPFISSIEICDVHSSPYHHELRINVAFDSDKDYQGFADELDEMARELMKKRARIKDHDIEWKEIPVIEEEKPMKKNTKTVTKPVSKNTISDIDKIIVSGPATIGFWDKQKVIIKLSENDTFDAEKAVLLLTVKNMFGNDSEYHAWMKRQMKLMASAMEHPNNRKKSVKTGKAPKGKKTKKNEPQITKYKWNDNEIGYLMENHNKMTYVEIAKYLGRSASSVHAMAYRLKIRCLTTRQKQHAMKTVIKNGVGKLCPGYKIPKNNSCTACPYLVVDVDGDDACYKEEYENCDHNN